MRIAEVIVYVEGPSDRDAMKERLTQKSRKCCEIYSITIPQPFRRPVFPSGR